VDSQYSRYEEGDSVDEEQYRQHTPVLRLYHIVSSSAIMVVRGNEYDKGVEEECESGEQMANVEDGNASA